MTDQHPFRGDGKPFSVEGGPVVERCLDCGYTQRAQINRGYVPMHTDNFPGPGHMRSPAEDDELTRLLREWDRITARIEQLGVKMPRRPGAVTIAEWENGEGA